MSSAWSAGAVAGGRIEHGDAEPSAALLLDTREFPGQRFGQSAGGAGRPAEQANTCECSRGNDEFAPCRHPSSVGRIIAADRKSGNKLGEVLDDPRRDRGHMNYFAGSAAALRIGPQRVISAFT